jgi:integrase
MLKPKVLMEFLQRSAQARKPMGCVGLTSALRNYFRFLQLCGHQVGALLDALPRVKRCSRPLPERILTAEQVRLWLGGIDRSTAEGRRDFAMALCLCDLGLRVGDLARLTLDDLDWRRGAIRIPNGKRKRPYWLPLSPRVGKAIAAYVRHDRPKTERRELFVRHRTPSAQPLASWNIQSRLQKVAREQGLPQPLTGTHALRHTVATRVYEKGTPLKEVADLLGHDNIKSTVVYAKLNQRELAEIALPWPEVLS